MNVLLVQPPLTTATEIQPPLGLSVLAAYLLGEGHRASGQYLEVFSEALRERQPSVVGFTSMFNNSLHAERLIKTAKHFGPDIVTVGGGSHFGALPKRSLERIESLDFVIKGEGEIAFSSLLSTLDRGGSICNVPGLCYRSHEGIVQNASPELLHLRNTTSTWARLSAALDLASYAATIPVNSPRKTIYIEAGRGCPFACSFCATAPFWERRYRVKPIECIISEMRYLYESFGYDLFMLVHDLLTADKKFMKDLCDALFAARLPVEWTANHRADLELGPLAPKMRSAGCLSVFMGIESASDRIQKTVHKGLTQYHTLSTVRSLANVGIASTCSFIVGFADETDVDVSATLDFAGRLKMMGAEPVQVHRLRRWPPAPLASVDSPSSFDLEALRLEFPSDNISERDIGTIESDPAFFMGYFTPHSTAGSPFQLAQVELLFANLLAVFPLTAAAIARVFGTRLVQSYYHALANQGSLSRADLSSPLKVREMLFPYIRKWVEHDPSLSDWERVVVTGALDYESARADFMAEAGHQQSDVASRQSNWTEFRSDIDVVKLIGLLVKGEELMPSVCKNEYVIFTRNDTGTVKGFALAERHMEQLRAGDPALVTMLEEKAAA